jgi:hypothetical protein
LLDLVLSGVNDGADFLPGGRRPARVSETDLPVSIELDEHGVHGLDAQVHF